MWQMAIAAVAVVAAMVASPAAAQQAEVDSPAGLAQALLLRLAEEFPPDWPPHDPRHEGRVICMEAEFGAGSHVESLDVSAAIDSMRKLHGRAAPGPECDVRRKVIQAADSALQKPLLTYPEGPMLHTATGALAVKYSVRIRMLPEEQTVFGVRIGDS
jgi:hypothetical protein